MRQVATRQGVLAAVETGEADVGLCSFRPMEMPEKVRFEPVYELELVLLVPHDHPLAKTKIRREHLVKYPLLNGRGLYPDWGVAAALESLGVYRHSEHRIELEMARSIRLYVRNGMGIGIVARPAGREPLGDVAERPLDAVFQQRLTMYAYYRSRVDPDKELLGFLQVIRDMQTHALAE